jgi:hypothetical protein
MMSKLPCCQRHEGFFFAARHYRRRHYPIADLPPKVIVSSPCRKIGITMEANHGWLILVQLCGAGASAPIATRMGSINMRAAPAV